MSKWSRKNKDCVQCGGNGRPHKGRGLCILCYDKLRAKNPKSRLSQERYRTKHRQEIRQRQKVDYLQKREEMFILLGDECNQCGFQDKRALQIDHINGGGIKERLTLNTKDFHRKVLKSIHSKENKYQLLCANCNWIKRFNNKEWGGAPKKHL